VARVDSYDVIPGRRPIDNYADKNVRFSLFGNNGGFPIIGPRSSKRFIIVFVKRSPSDFWRLNDTGRAGRNALRRCKMFAAMNSSSSTFRVNTSAGRLFRATTTDRKRSLGFNREGGKTRLVRPNSGEGGRR